MSWGADCDIEEPQQRSLIRNEVVEGGNSIAVCCLKQMRRTVHCVQSTLCSVSVLRTLEDNELSRQKEKAMTPRPLDRLRIATSSR